MKDEEYQELQNTLVAYPESGKLIQGSGGLRKYVGELLAKEKEAVLEPFIILLTVKIKFLCSWFMQKMNVVI